MVPKEFLPYTSYPESILVHGSIADYETGAVGVSVLSSWQLYSYVVIDLTLIRENDFFRLVFCF